LTGIFCDAANFYKNKSVVINNNNSKLSLAFFFLYKFTSLNPIVFSSSEECSTVALKKGALPWPKTSLENSYYFQIENMASPVRISARLNSSAVKVN